MRFRGFFRGVPDFLGGVPGFLRGVPGFLGGVPGFLGVFLVFLGVFRVFGGCSGFSGCSGMFRDVPVFRCSWKYYMPIFGDQSVIIKRLLGYSYITLVYPAVVNIA